MRGLWVLMILKRDSGSIFGGAMDGERQREKCLLL